MQARRVFSFRCECGCMLYEHGALSGSAPTQHMLMCHNNACPHVGVPFAYPEVTVTLTAALKGTLP